MIPLLVSQDMFLKEEGITQKWTAFSGGGDTVRAVVTGGHQLGHPAPTAAVIAFQQGQPVKFTSKISPAILKAISDDMLADKQLKEAPDWKKLVGQSFLAPELRSHQI